MNKRIATFFIMCILAFCLCGCGENPEKYREEIMIGQWIIPGDEGKVCEFREAGSCTINGEEYSWKYKKNLLKNLRVDIFKNETKVYELQVFEAEDQGYRYMMNLGSAVEKKYMFTSENAGYINLNHYEKVEISLDNYEKYFVIGGNDSSGEQKIILKPEYEARIKADISSAVFDVVFGQADFFLTCDNLAGQGSSWGCVLKPVGVDLKEKNSDPVLIVGQAKGKVYFDMTQDSTFPVKPKEN